MSHFTVLVIGADLEGQLAPYDENTTVPVYVEQTKEQAIQKERANLIDYRDNGLYAEYLKDPEAYVQDHGWNAGHLTYITQEFPLILERLDDDEFMYERAARWYDAEMIAPNGDLLSTYNPNSQWDWYQIGGRWDRMLITTDGRQVNECKAYELDIDMTWPEDHTVFAMVQDGEWKQKGKMGWFGFSRDEMDGDRWNKIVKETLRGLEPLTPITLVDAHI